jgi:hypothetical protein
LYIYFYLGGPTVRKKISIDPAKRVRDLPPYLFATIDRMKEKALGKGVDLIDLSIGDPDTPTPGHIIESMTPISFLRGNALFQTGCRGLV